ncbi:MAG TPA: hypothetical protein PK867_14880 [Pirellulales bacterium]|nr:hypothetical protein [Pirellulales bacterium]
MRAIEPDGKSPANRLVSAELIEHATHVGGQIGKPRKQDTRRSPLARLAVRHFGRQQLDELIALAGQLGVFEQIFFRTRGFAGFEAIFEVDVNQFAEQTRPLFGVADEERVDVGALIALPGAFERGNDLVESRPGFDRQRRIASRSGIVHCRRAAVLSAACSRGDSASDSFNATQIMGARRPDSKHRAESFSLAGIGVASF